MRFRRFVLALVALVVAAVPARADQPQAEKPPHGQGKYVIVLWEPGTPVPGKPDERMKRVPEPDAAALGGRLLSKHANRRVVFLPYGIAKQLRRHEAVAYVQRIWTGEPAQEWDEAETAGASARPGALSTNADPTFTWDKSYTYDADGNIITIGSDQFGYDAMSRLTSATVAGHSQSYAYDGFGNLTEIATAGATPVAIPADPSTNRLMGHTYDAAGNVTSREDGTYVYDSLNMIAEVRLTPGSPRRILYDADEERIGTLMNGNERWTLRGLDGQILREYKSWMNIQDEWVWEQDHIRGEGQLIAGEMVTWAYDNSASAFTYGGRRHYHLDHLGSVRVVTNQAGRAISENDFHPFGKAITRQHQEQINYADPHTDGMRFAGHWRDFMGYPGVEDDSYLDYMHARYYDPNAARFLSVDPTWESAHLSLPQSWNRYSYVMNNPMKYTDPTGRVFECHTVTNDDGSTEQICSEEIDVEAEDPKVKPAPEPSDPSWIVNAWDSITHEAENLKHLSWRDAPIMRENRDTPCKTYGERFLQSFAETNGVPGLAAPTGLGLMTAGKTAQVTGGITPLQWARAGFGGATLRGTAFTALETGAIAGATTLTNFAFVTVAWEVGVAGGSAINAALTDGCM